MASLQYVDYPEYNALILRRSFAELIKPNAILDLSRQWLTNTDASWNEHKKRWLFPSGASLTFGFLDRDGSQFGYQGLVPEHFRDIVLCTSLIRGSL